MSALLHTAASNCRSPRLKTDRGPWRPSGHIGFGLRIRPSWLSLAQEKLLRRRWLRPAPQVAPFFAIRHAMSNARSPSRSPSRRSTLGATSYLYVLSSSSLRKSSHQGAISFQICTDSRFNASMACSSVMRKSSSHFVMRTTLSDRPANHSTTRFNANTATTCT